MPSDDVMVQKRNQEDPYPKCSLLSLLGIDYLHQFVKKFDTVVDLVTVNMSAEKMPCIVELVNRIMSDEDTTECILLSIVFFLLGLHHQDVDGKELCTEILNVLIAKCGIPANVLWVNFSLFFFLF